jgi:hypothetical protein
VAWCNNLDQGLALAYMPALAAVPALLRPGDWRRWALLGALAAGLLLTYVELAPFVLAGAALAALPRAWAERGRRRAWLAGGALAVATAALLLAPARAGLVRFARSQAADALRAPGHRPGEGLFDGLRGGAACAAWGFGGECAGKPVRPEGALYGEALTVLFALGLLPLARAGQWGVSLAAAVLLAAALFWLGLRDYPYAGYKVLSAAWWLTVAVAAAGAGRLLGKVPRPGWRAAGAGVAVAAALLVQLRLGRAEAPLWPSGCGAAGAEFRPEGAVAAAGGRPLLVAVDDWKANLVALYHLRDTPLYLAAFRSHLTFPAHIERLERAREVGLGEVGYVLSDDTRASLAWHAAAGPPTWAGGRLRLWRLAPADGGEARLLHFEGSCTPFHQLEARGGRPFFRVGADPATLYVYAARAGRLRLRGAFAPEPGGACRLELCGPAGGRQELEVAAGEGTLTVPVPAGVSRLTARVLGPAGGGPPPGLAATVLAVGLAP